MTNDPKTILGKIPWEEIIFMVDDWKKNPKIIESAKGLFKRVNFDFNENDIEMLQKLTEGTLLLIWLDHGGKIPEKYGYRR